MTLLDAGVLSSEIMNDWTQEFLDGVGQSPNEKATWFMLIFFMNPIIFPSPPRLTT